MNIKKAPRNRGFLFYKKAWENTWKFVKVEGKVMETFGEMFLVFVGENVYDRCVTNARGKTARIGKAPSIIAADVKSYKISARLRLQLHRGVRTVKSGECV